MRAIHLSRRTFTEEFKLAAVRRVQAGTPIRELSGELEVSRNLLYRWAREFRKAPEEAFPAVSGTGRKVGLRTWSARSVNRPWRLII